MNALVCELCGGNNLIKEDGYFVCQNCGTKYTPEEAKKLIISGTINIQGSVALDNSSQIANLTELAEKALESENWADVEKYYGQIIQYNPRNWEAYFYTIYAAQMRCENEKVETAALNIENSIAPTLSLINKFVEDNELKELAFHEVDVRCLDAAVKLFDKSADFFQYNVQTARNLAIPLSDKQNDAIIHMLHNSADEFEKYNKNEIAAELRKFAYDHFEYKRSPKPMIFGIIASVLTLSSCAYFIGWATGLVAIVLGLIAFFTGVSKRKESRGTDPFAKAGMIMGAIATPLAVIGIIISIVFTVVMVIEMGSASAAVHPPAFGY